MQQLKQEPHPLTISELKANMGKLPKLHKEGPMTDEDLVTAGLAEWQYHYLAPHHPGIRKIIKKLKQTGKTPEELGIDPKVLIGVKVKKVLVRK